MIALTLFRLQDGRTIDDYVEYSQRFIRPGMLAMPSVLAFRDFTVAESYDGATPSAQLVEVIDITDAASFKRDNESGPGAEVAVDWATWCATFEVLFCEEIPA